MGKQVQRADLGSVATAAGIPDATIGAIQVSVVESGGSVLIVTNETAGLKPHFFLLCYSYCSSYRHKTKTCCLFSLTLLSCQTFADTASVCSVSADTTSQSGGSTSYIGVGVGVGVVAMLWLFCFLVFRNKKSTQSTVHASLPVTKSAPPANPVVVGTVGFDQGESSLVSLHTLFYQRLL